MHDAQTTPRVDERRRITGRKLALPAALGLTLTFATASAWGQGLAVTGFVALTALTGYADSQGFVHASRAWDGGQLVVREALLSGLAFFIGVVAYLVVVRFVAELGVRSAVLQTMGWFAVTIAAVVLTDGGYERWSVLDTTTAIVVVAGLGLLLYRTAG